MSDFIGTQVPETVPEYMTYMYTQFAKELQRRIRTFLVNTTVYVKPFIEEDMVTVEITHRDLGIQYRDEVRDVLDKIKAEADDPVVVRKLGKDIVDLYRDYIWHMFFVDFKKRMHKSEDPEKEFARSQEQ